MLAVLDDRIKTAERSEIGKIAADWVEELRTSLKLPEMLPVYEMEAGMHTHIDPVEEAQAMVGDKNVIVVKPEE